MNNGYKNFLEEYPTEEYPDAPTRSTGSGDLSVTKYQAQFGDFVEKTLTPQISRKAAEKMSSKPFNPFIKHEEDTKENKSIKKVNKFLNNIGQRVNWSRLLYQQEYKLSAEGNTTIVADYIGGENGFNFYIPKFNITQIDPATGELLYLQIVRFVKAGNFLNIMSEIRTRKETTFQFMEMEGKEGSPNAPKSNKDLKSVLGKSKKVKFDKLKQNMLNSGDDTNYDDLEEPQTVKNEFGFIFAQYIENVPDPSGAFKGQPDVDPNNSYTPWVNKMYVRFNWELDFNKSKFIINEEIGTNMYGSSSDFNNMVENNFVLKKNSFNRPLGDSDSGFQYFETSNQNLTNIKEIFDYFLKKWWEHAGQHQSAVDAGGKNVTSFEAKLEREGEELRYNAKVRQREFAYKHLVWKILKVAETFGLIKKKVMDKIFLADIMVDFSVDGVVDFKELLEMEIMKIQTNLSTRAKSLGVLEEKTEEDMKALAEEYLKINTEDIETELKAKPIQVNTPQPSNPQGKDNNQKKGFMNQKDKGGN